MEKDELIGSVRKNAMESVRLQVRKYRGGVYVDARVWVMDSKEEAQTEFATKESALLEARAG
jgi:hypothetical protein